MTEAKKFKIRPGKIAKFVVGVFVAFLMLVPFVWMLSASFKNNGEIFSTPVRWIPEVFRVENYIKVWTDIEFPRYFMNTLKVAVLITFLQIFLCSLSAYAFAKLRFPGRDKIFLLYLATMMVPWHAIMIPQFMVVTFLGLYNSHWALIILSGFSAFGVFILRQNMISIPDSLSEAARIDGCGPIRTYIHIIIPLTKTGLATLLILTFNGAWNDYMAPMIYLDSPELRTIQLGLALFKQEYTAEYGPIMAGTVVSIIPIIIVYILAQKNIIEGVAAGAVKG